MKENVATADIYLQQSRPDKNLLMSSVVGGCLGLNLMSLIIRHYGLYDCEAERLFSEKVVSKFGGFAKAPYICTMISSGCANSGAHKRDKAI